ncbi:hypothetical protein [Microscilla marina]|uniref:Uncharacterized protein n=1 Tax=Microscilla marina ATCC 23134 TaxID=313606 RepID=A1ZTT9_MICM2|nr:hypothetical protein [Microscilla marina]EAY26191.1 hypothetical protein M23134_02523 [Microscilla marina ATCC 23134]
MQIIKTFTIVTTLLLLPFLTLKAQTSHLLDYIVLNSGDTLYGKVKHVNQRKVPPRYYKKIRFTNTKGKRKKYKRADVAAFNVNNTNYEGFWLSQSSRGMTLINPQYDIDPKNGERYFLRVISKGKLSHYYLEWWEQGEAGSSWMDLFRKEKDQFFIRATQGLFGLKRKTLAKYFANCPSLQEKIKKKQIRKVSQVVDYYNKNCVD